MADAPSFEDYSAAMDRARDAKAAGQQYDPGDVDIIRRGASAYSQQYDQGGAAPAQPQATPPSAPSPPPSEAPTSDPNSWGNIAARGGINTVMGLPDVAWQGANVIRHLAGSTGNFKLPSQMTREALGVPEMGENATTAQKALEFGIPLVAGALIPAGAAATAAKAGSKLAAFLGSGAANLFARPAMSMAGAYAGQKLGGEPGEYVGGMLGGFGPEIVHGLGGAALAPYYKSTAAARGTEPFIPSASDVAEAAGRLSDLGKSIASTIGPGGERYAEEIPLTYGMLGNRAAKISQAEFAKAGAWPAYSAQEAPMEFMPRANELAIMQRRELPPMTPGNQEVIQLAQQARSNAIARGVSPADVSDPSTLDAMQNWIKSKMGNEWVDVTPTHNLMQNMVNVPGGGRVAQLPSASSMGFEGGQNTRTAISAQDAALLKNSQTINDPYTGQDRVMVPYQQLQDWKQNLGLRDALASARPDSLQGLAGSAYDRVYGSIKNDIANSTPAGVSPEALNTAVDIEHRELAARDLPKILNQLGPQVGTKTKPGVASVLQQFPEGERGTHLYSRATGGEYDPSGAPAPIPGSGDIRQTLADLVTLHNATTLPGGEATGAAGWMQKARESASAAIPGLELEKRLGGGALGAIVGTAMGLPAAPYGGAALGILGGPFGWNLLRSKLQQNPRVLGAMAGRQVPASPSANPIWTLPAYGTSAATAVTPAPPKKEWTPPPWVNPIPGRQSFRDLPTTKGILNAWNAANIGRSRAETAA